VIHILKSETAFLIDSPAHLCGSQSKTLGKNDSIKQENERLNQTKNQHTKSFLINLLERE
jgi:hypothetical protein